MISRHSRAFSVGTWVLLGIGAVLRVARYADNRSFWLDEALLGLNLIERSASELGDALDYVQSAPYGFLLAEKASIELFGDAELVFRLIPLLSSLGALVVFGLMVRRVLDPPAAALAAAAFAFAEPVIYQASEAKPYSTDVLAGLLIVWLALRAEDSASSSDYARGIAALGVVGAVAVWISYPAAFVLAAAGGALAVRALLTRAVRQVASLAVVGGVWLVAFALSYATSAGTIASVRASVFPGEPSAGRRFGETLRLAWYSLSDPGGFYPRLRLVALVCLVVGLVAFARERVDRLVLVAGPGALTIAAALLSRYPLGGRFVLFVAPLGFILVARGAQALWELAGRRVSAAAVAGILALALTGNQAVRAAQHLSDPPRPENVRSLLQSLARQWRSGDTLYVYRDAQYVLRWYAECKDCGVRPLPFAVRNAAPGQDDGIDSQAALVSSPPSIVVGRGVTNDAFVARTIRSLGERRRVWFLFAHAAQHREGAPNDEVRFLRAIDRSGTRVLSERESGASLYLVDFSSMS